MQNWSQDRRAQRELGGPRKLLDSIMELEADIADYEAKDISVFFADISLANEDISAFCFQAFLLLSAFRI